MTQLRRFPPIDQSRQVLEAESFGDTIEDHDAEEHDEPANSPGGLLGELERRQDDVLVQLDALNARIEAVLFELGVKLDDQSASIDRGIG